MYLINVEKNNFWQFCEEYFLVLCSFYFKKEKCKCLDLACTHNNNNKKSQIIFIDHYHGLQFLNLHTQLDKSKILWHKVWAWIWHFSALMHSEKLLKCLAESLSRFLY